MKILAVTSWFPHPADNGTRLRIAALLERLSRDHAVTLLSFGRPEGAEQVEPLLRYCQAVETVPLPDIDADSFKTRHLLSPMPRYFRDAVSLPMERQIARRINEHDVVVAFEILAAHHVARAPPGPPTMFDGAEIGGFVEAYRTATGPWRQTRAWLTWWKHQRFLKELIRRFDVTTVVSELERRLVVSIGCDPAGLVVVPNGADLPSRGAALEGGRRRHQLVYTGSVRYAANLDAVRWFAHEVLPRLRRSIPELTFVVTGETTGVDLSDLDGVGGVSFAGRLPEVTPVLAESLACVVPLRQGGGTRLKVLEAMAVGTPVVSTTKGAEGLDVEDGRHLLTGDTPDRLADQIMRLAGDPRLAASLVTAARARVAEHYSWESAARALEDGLQRAVRRHGEGVGDAPPPGRGYQGISRDARRPPRP